MLLLRKIIVVLLVFLVFESYSQTSTFEKGKVIDSITVSGANETFALYLPKSYDPNKLSSVIFIFDPSAQGRAAVERFVETAERYNHILVCSNHTRNHSDENFEVTNRLFNTIFSTFNIDQNLIYAAGFSGGSRLASTIAVLTNQIEGVIACGAGFSPNPSHTPNPSHSFSYLGMVGALDMNYHEMHNAQLFLNKMNLDNELFTNNDRHQWPSPSQLAKAIGYLELQAYKKNRKRPNNDLIQLLYNEWYNDAREAEKELNYVKALKGYQKLRDHFSRYLTLDSIVAKIDYVRDSPIYKTQYTQSRVVEREEEEAKKAFFDRFHREINMKNPPKKLKWWEKEVQKLKETYSESDDPALAQLGARIENMLHATAIETANIKLIGKEVEKAIYCHKLLQLFIPNSPYSYFLLAKDYALLGDKAKMMEQLHLAKKNGLSNRKYVDREAAFQNYRNDSGFIEFLNGLK